ncbi:MAG: endonuclease, partial [Aeromonas veronii]
MQKTLSYAALLLVSQFPQLALADTDVYLTNNSPEPLQIDIRQSGSGQLQPGSQWSQHRTELGPWESAMVLSFNRYEGVKAGKSYLFETRVTTAGGDVYRLNQLMEGTWWNTTLQHGGET